MTDRSDGPSQSSARGEAAWKQEIEAIAARNQRTQHAGRAERETYERKRMEARRVAEANAQALLLRGRRTP